MAERFARQRLRALAKVEGLHDDGKPTVLFLCVHNAGRSQMAMGFFQQLAGDRAVAWSGGQRTGDQRQPRRCRGHGRARDLHLPGVPQALDRRDGPRCRRRHHDGLRRCLPALPRQAIRGVGPRRPRRARTSPPSGPSATRSNAASGSSRRTARPHLKALDDRARRLTRQDRRRGGVRGRRCRARRRGAGRCVRGRRGSGSRPSGAGRGWRGSPGRSRSAGSRGRRRRRRVTCRWMQRLPDAAAAVAVADVDRGLADAGVDRPGRGRRWRGPADDLGRRPRRPSGGRAASCASSVARSGTSVSKVALPVAMPSA